MDVPTRERLATCQHNTIVVGGLTIQVQVARCRDVFLYVDGRAGGCACSRSLGDGPRAQVDHPSGVVQADVGARERGTRDVGNAQTRGLHEQARTTGHRGGSRGRAVGLQIQVACGRGRCDGRAHIQVARRGAANFERARTDAVDLCVAHTQCQGVACEDIGTAHIDQGPCGAVLNGDGACASVDGARLHDKTVGGQVDRGVVAALDAAAAPRHKPDAWTEPTHTAGPGHVDGATAGADADGGCGCAIEGHACVIHPS